MWLGSSRVLYVTLLTTGIISVGIGLGMSGRQAYAQQQDVITNQPVAANTTITNMPVPNAPPQAQLNQQSPFVAQPVAPAPRLEPMLSPQDMAARAAREAAERQQAAANQAAAAQQQGQMQQQQQLVPVMAPMQQLQAMPVQMMQQQQIPMQVDPQQQAAQVPVQATVATPETAPAEQPAPQAQIETPVTATNTTGFATEAANAQMPTTGGMLPAGAVVTNPGMDMSINPDLVGGYDPNLPASATNPVPYEVQLEQRTQELQQRARAMAFEQAKKSALPMETYEIRDVLGRLKDTQEAIQTPVRPAPKPSNVIKTISTDPSARPQTIHLAAGNVSTLNIVDVTGEPWPIVDIGFGGAFDVKPPEAGGHVIRITPLRDFARGNLVVRLLKMTTPLTFSLQAGGENVYYRFDARIPDYGPNAKMPLISEGIGAHAGDKVTTSFLEGVPPTGATKLIVEGVDARTTAFRFSGTMYVRTPLSLLSPAWQGSATSADGMNVYLLQEAPVLLLSDKGALVRARITDQKRISGGF